MNNKQIGVLLIVMGLLFTAFLYIAKQREDFYINTIIEQQGGVCYLDGICLHQREFTLYYIGGILVAGLIILGAYMLLFDKSQKVLLKQHQEVAEALKEAKDRDEFQAYFAGFPEEEKKVLKAIYEQEGIQQATLRYRVAMSKTSLSLLLKSLEERGIITRKEHGKTNEVFLVKKF